MQVDYFQVPNSVHYLGYWFGCCSREIQNNNGVNTIEAYFFFLSTNLGRWFVPGRWFENWFSNSLISGEPDTFCLVLSSSVRGI